LDSANSRGASTCCLKPVAALTGERMTTSRAETLTT
jgi:hypothetical protein